MRQFFSSLLEVLEITIVAVGAVFLIRSFLIQPFLVSGSSMVPNFSDGDYLLVDQVTYQFRPPQRGEVVVFRSPGDKSTYFIKRIIGLPGEGVRIGNGKVEISSAPEKASYVLDENYLPPTISTGGNNQFVLKKGEYFVLGDNRSYSFDSRSWGPLNYKDIVGVVRLRLWPLTELTAFAAPAYR